MVLVYLLGQTQALSACTLAPLGEHQIIDGLGVEESNDSSTITTSLNFLLVRLVVLAHQGVVKSVMVH